jgi:hypothetical protein
MISSYLTPDYRRASFYIFAMILAENRRGAKKKKRGGRNMDNYARATRVFNEISSIGKQAGIKKRFTNRMLRQIERNRVILNSMYEDEEMKPIVTLMLKVITLWCDFAKAYNSGNNVDANRIADENMRLGSEIITLLERRMK